jgi:hypothetical protein
MAAWRSSISGFESPAVITYPLRQHVSFQLFEIGILGKDEFAKAQEGKRRLGLADTPVSQSAHAKASMFFTAFTASISGSSSFGGLS